MPIAVALGWSRNFSTTMRAVNADTASIAIGSGNGSSGGFGMNIRTTPTSITSEPSTASLPTEPVSHALALALTENLLPSPTSTEALNEYQSRISVPSSVTIVPPTTIHMLRVTLDMSMHTLLA